MSTTNASLSIQILPQEQDKEGVIRIVDSVIEYIKSTGLKYFVCPYETTIDGDFDQLMDIFANCQKICIEGGAPYVMTYAKIAYKPDTSGVWTIEDKVAKHHTDKKF